MKLALRPITPEQACDWLMPYGRHRGKSLAEIVGTDDGPRYLNAMIANEYIGGSLKRAAVTLLTHLRLYAPPIAPEPVDDLDDLPF